MHTAPVVPELWIDQAAAASALMAVDIHPASMLHGYCMDGCRCSEGAWMLHGRQPTVVDRGTDICNSTIVTVLAHRHLHLSTPGVTRPFWVLTLTVLTPTKEPCTWRSNTEHFDHNR
jgi:hypothetical protein